MKIELDQATIRLLIIMALLLGGIGVHEVGVVM